MTSVFVSFVVLLAFCLVSDALTVRNNTFSEVDVIKDVIFHEKLLFESSARSLVNCAVRCFEQDDCRLFTWVNSSPGGSSARCRGHSSCCPNQTTSASVAGAKAYRLEGKECTSATTAWLNKNCENNTECPAVHSECFQGQCLCTPGYTYSISQDNCIALTTVWLNKNCENNTECPAVHSECFKGQCLCTPGYYYSISQDNCTANCSSNQLQSSFLRYTLTDIHVCTAFSFNPTTLAQCLEKCLCEPRCHSVDFGYTSCCGHPGTTPVRRNVLNQYDLYQRNCE